MMTQVCFMRENRRLTIVPQIWGTDVIKGLSVVVMLAFSIMNKTKGLSVIVMVGFSTLTLTY
ncbi:hypothetical protein [Xenorhabdus taiwanensis]|uniref:hypothetical protein n=1 Tax=Xenorhabdus taiwanensis TaxID=3085177 RepID=UPI0035A708A0